MVPSWFDCNTRNCIHIAQCKLCDSTGEKSYPIIFEGTYFGQTIQKFHKRINGHRSCFNFEDRMISLHFQCILILYYVHHRYSFSHLILCSCFIKLIEMRKYPEDAGPLRDNIDF